MEEAVQRLCLPRTGVRDALGRPVVEDDLARFARLPHKRLRSVVSRPQRAVKGVTSLGPHANALYFSVAVVSQYGSFRAWVRLSLAAMEVGELVCFSANELAFLFFLQAGASTHYGLRPGTRWCDVMGMLGAGLVAAKLQALSGVSYPPLRIAQAMAYLREHTESTGGQTRSGFIDGSLVWVLPGVAVTASARPDDALYEDGAVDDGVGGGGHDTNNDGWWPVPGEEEGLASICTTRQWSVRHRVALTVRGAARKKNSPCTSAPTTIAYP